VDLLEYVETMHFPQEGWGALHANKYFHENLLNIVEAICYQRVKQCPAGKDCHDYHGNLIKKNTPYKERVQKGNVVRGR